MEVLNDLRPAELHLHLDGSLREETIHDLAKSLGLAVPDKLRFTQGMTLPECLERFGFTVSLLQTPNALRRVTKEIRDDVLVDGVPEFELRFAPHLHTSNGLTAEEAAKIVANNVGTRGRVILCGLYGNTPELFHELVEIASSTRRVVGIDLAGGPMKGHRYGMRDYAPAFAEAKRKGVRRTVHGSEGRSFEEIVFAIKHLYAERIGHGTSLHKSEEALNLVVAKGVTMEVCITSNWHTGIIPERKYHPFLHWLTRRVKMALCADNTYFSGVTTLDEYGHAYEILGSDQHALGVLHQIADHSHNALFR